VSSCTHNQLDTTILVIGTYNTNISEYPFEYDAYFDDDVILSSIASMMAADAKIEEFTWQCWPGYYNVLYYFQ